MKEQVIQTVRSIVEITIHYIPMAIACLMLIHLIGDERANSVSGIMLVLVPVSFYFIRRKITQPFVYLFMHIAVVLIVWMFPYGNNVTHYIYTIMAATYLVMSFSLHFQKSDLEKKKDFFDIPILAIVSVLVIEYFIAVYMKMNHLLPGIASAAVLTMLFYYISTYSAHYLRFLRTNRAAVRNLPKDRLLKEGGIMTLVFTLASTAILFLCASANFLDNWFYKVLQYIKRGIVFILKRILPKELPEDNEIITANTLNEEFNPFGEMQAVSSTMAEIIEQVVRILAVTGMVVFVTSLIVGIVTAYLRAFQRDNIEDEIREYIRKEKSEELKTKEAMLKSNPLGYLSPGERIRRIYAKTIQNCLKRNKEAFGNYPVSSMTGRELMILFLGENEKEYLDLVELYEKARYSPRECTREDVRTARRLANLLHKI